MDFPFSTPTLKLITYNALIVLKKHLKHIKVKGKKRNILLLVAGSNLIVSGNFLIQRYKLFAKIMEFLHTC